MNSLMEVALSAETIRMLTPWVDGEDSLHVMVSRRRKSNFEELSQPIDFNIEI